MSYTPSLKYGYTKSTGTPWTLADTTSFAFYNMLSGVTDAGSGKVSAWTDFLGNTLRDVAQATGGNRPTLTVDGVVFNGTSDHLFNVNPFMANSANGVTVMAIMSAPANTSSSARWSVAEGSTASTLQNMTLLAKDNIVADYGKITQALRNDANVNILTYGGNSGAGTAFDNTFKLLSVNFNKSTGFITTSINGVNQSPPLAFTFSGVFTLNRFSLGAFVRSTVSNHSSMTIKGMAFLDATISTDDHQRSEGYLCHLYNRTDLLPIGHPYKTNPPLVG